MKRSFIVVGIILVIATSSYIFIADTSLRIRTALTQAKEVATFLCADDFSWKVVDNDGVLGSIWGIDAGLNPHIYEFRELRLVHNGQTIEIIQPFAAKNLTRNNEFPTGEAFLSATVLDSEMKIADVSRATWYIIELHSSDISLQDFKSITQCLQDIRPTINALLADKNKPSVSLGSIMLVDDFVKRDPLSNAPEFVCDGGKRAITLDYNLYTVTTTSSSSNTPSAFTRVGTIGPDGVLYEAKNIGIDVTQPRLPVDLACVNSRGESLKSFLASIPNRLIGLR